MAGLRIDDDLYNVDLTAQGETATGDYPMRFYSIVRVPLQPECWANASNELCIHDIAAEIYNEDTDNELTLKWEVDNRGIIDVEETYDTVIDPTNWQTELNDVSYPVGVVCDNSYPASLMDKVPQYVVTQMQIHFDVTDVPNDEMRVYNWWQEPKFDNTYSGNEVELTDRSGAGKQYNPDESVSAWHVMKILIDSYNMMLYKSRPCWNVPVFGQFDLDT